MTIRSLVFASLLSFSCAASRVDDGAEPAGPSCTDGTLNGDEVDVDCGASCPACANGKKCVAPTGCASGACAEGACQKPESCNPETDEALCERLAQTCGKHPAVDLCGDARTADCGACPRVVTCTGATSSGLSGTTTISSLSEAQRTQFCDFLACGFGGYGKSVACGELSVSGPKDLDDCNGDLTKCSTITVADWEGCQKKIAAAPCNALQTLFSAPECAQARTCAAN